MRKHGLAVMLVFSGLITSVGPTSFDGGPPHPGSVHCEVYAWEGSHLVARVHCVTVGNVCRTGQHRTTSTLQPFA